MKTNEMSIIKINKNRGWRGLAEVEIFTKERDLLNRNIFSFSQDMWDELIFKNKITIQDKDFYYIITFDNSAPLRSRLPRPDQQRSVLIKDYSAHITEVNKYSKATYQDAPYDDRNSIYKFRANRNNHTHSAWNNIGTRVVIGEI